MPQFQFHFQLGDSHKFIVLGIRELRFSQKKKKEIVSSHYDDRFADVYLFCLFLFFLRVVLSIVMGGFILGQISALSPDYEKAKVAAARLFRIFDRKSLIDSSSEDGLTPVRMQST